jgi:hypothetical protein
LWCAIFQVQIEKKEKLINYLINRHLANFYLANKQLYLANEQGWVANKQGLFL